MYLMRLTILISLLAGCRTEIHMMPDHVKAVCAPAKITDCNGATFETKYDGYWFSEHAVTKVLKSKVK